MLCLHVINIGSYILIKTNDYIKSKLYILLTFICNYCYLVNVYAGYHLFAASL